MGLRTSAGLRRHRRLFTIPASAAYNVRHTTRRPGVIVRAGGHYELLPRAGRPYLERRGMAELNHLYAAWGLTRG